MPSPWHTVLISIQSKPIFEDAVALSGGVYFRGRCSEHCLTMSFRLPSTADFPSSLKLSITPPPTSQQQPVNILILLHGLGDTNSPFTSLGKQLALPETACLSLQAPTPLPFDLGGYHWGDDIHFDSANGQMDIDTGFSKAAKVIEERIIKEILVEKCGYSPRNVLLFGFGGRRPHIFISRGAGGVRPAGAVSIRMEEELGGIISIGGPMTASCTAAKKSKTPVLVLGGSSDTLITRSAVIRLKTAFNTVEYHKWDKEGDGMPGNREEMLPIIKFFARTLRSRSGVPEGSVEIG